VRETKEFGMKAAALRIGLIPLLELPLELFPGGDQMSHKGRSTTFARTSSSSLG
jgi:hypothetical protein